MARRTIIRMRSLEAYRDLIARVERLAVADPRRYRRNLALLAAFGCVYALALAALLGLCALAVLVLIALSNKIYLSALALLPLGVACLLARALWIKLPTPAGRRLRAQEAPALFEEIERVRRALNAKPVNEVVLTPEFNAAVTQVPRLGLFGWPRRYLILGLPLLASLPPYQFRAVLAHEFAHLAAHHARFGNWIYRIRQAWHRILQALEASQSPATRMLARFLAWYAPYFNAYSFVLARANEYHADRESARVTSTQDAADALVAVYGRGEYLESTFWSAFYRRADDEADPPARPFVEYVDGLRNMPPESAASALAAALARRTGLDDTHPSLTERLAALGAQARRPASFQISAAHALLGDLRVRLLAEFDRAWRESLTEAWKERHAFVQSMKEKLTLYTAAARSRELDPQEQWDYAAALEAVEGGVAALPLLDALLARHPRHAPAYYARGRIRLEQRDERGAADIERAMLLDEEAREPGAQLLYGYFYSRQDFSRCDRYRSTLEDLHRERQLAMLERCELKRVDALEPHGLREEDLAAWRELLAGETGIKRAWLARRRVRHLSKLPAYVLIVDPGLFSTASDERLAQLGERLSVGHTCLVVSTSSHPAAHRFVRRLYGALIYSRPR
jgi:Zn-dependent protease with chaperone function